MRIAIVHDYLTHFGGAERVLKAVMELFPHAPIFTLVYDKSQMGNFVPARRLRTSFLQQFPGARRSHRYLPLTLMPFAIEQFDFSEYDVVLSLSHSFSKGVITGANTLHISYCFTPTRYIWDGSHRYVREFSRNSLFQNLAPIALSYVRMWDYYAAKRADRYVTLSKYVAGRIHKYYGYKPTVIYPPVEIERFTPSASIEDYYIVVSRLVPYKRVDIAIEACNTLGRKLKVIGTGPEMEDLKRRAGNTIEFLGFVPDEQLPALYAKSRALLFPQEEDFGITPLEAAASGRPTIAYAAGGARETIQDGITGVFFPHQTAHDLVEAIQKFETMQWNSEKIISHAQTFSQQRFLREMEEYVHNQWKAFANTSWNIHQH